MAAFGDSAFSELAFDVGAFDFGTPHVISFSSQAFSKDGAFYSSAFSFDSQTPVLSGTPRRRGKRPPRRKPVPVVAGWWMLGIDESGHLTDEELLLFSSIDLD